MPLPFRLAACLLLPLVAACATATPPAVSPELRALVSRMPERIADFELQESVPNSSSNTAWTLRYRHAASGTLATVMMGTPGQPSVPDGPDSSAVGTMVNAMSLGVQAAGGGGGLTRVPDFGASQTGRPPEIRCTDLRRQPPEGQLQRVLICATGAADTLVAISIASRHPPEAMDAARLFMTNFALQVVERLRAPGGSEAIQAPVGSGRVFRL